MFEVMSGCSCDHEELVLQVSPKLTPDESHESEAHQHHEPCLHSSEQRQQHAASRVPVPRAVLEAARHKSSHVAAQHYVDRLRPEQVALEVTGLRLEAMPWLASATRLQSLALSFNRLAALPPLHAERLRTLNVACNALTQLPADIDSVMPNLQVRHALLCVLRCCVRHKQQKRVQNVAHAAHVRFDVLARLLAVCDPRNKQTAQ